MTAATADAALCAALCVTAAVAADALLAAVLKNEFCAAFCETAEVAADALPAAAFNADFIPFTFTHTHPSFTPFTHTHPSFTFLEGRVCGCVCVMEVKPPADDLSSSTSWPYRANFAWLSS